MLRRRSGNADEVAALRAEAHALREQTAALREQTAALTSELAATRAAQERSEGELRTRLDQVHGHLMSTLQVVVDDEAETRRRLRAARATPEYEAAFTDPEPLVSIVIPSYDNYAGLRDRSVPSALAQTYENVEVIVVGDAAATETDEVMASFSDPRLRYVNLERRGPYPDDRDGLWFTGGSPPLNRAFELSRGRWFAVLNDDDSHRPEMVASLLAVAREQRSEVAYGKLRYHEPERPAWELGVFPPTHHQFGWQMALQHGVLRLYDYEISCHLFNEPADWNRARRMLRTGVRFAWLDAVVGDYWPRRLWEEDAAS